MTCSSLPIWSYIARTSSFSPGNTKGGPGLQHCHIRSCATCQACQARVSSSVRKASFKSSPGRLDLFVKSLSLSSAGEYQPGPLATSWLCKRRHCGSRSPHMVRTSSFSSSRESHSQRPCEHDQPPSWRPPARQLVSHRLLDTSPPKTIHWEERLKVAMTTLVAQQGIAQLAAVSSQL